MGGGRSVKEKHIDDSWLLVGAIKKCECVPRILLKNGKRARNDLLKSQAKLREKRNEECQTTDVSKNVRNDALDKMEDDDGQGIAVRMLGRARPGADYMLGGASRLSADRILAEDVDGNAGQELTCKSHREGDVGAQSADCQDAVFRSTVVESINALREEVANLRSEFTQIKKLGGSASVHHARGKLCTLYVRVPESWLRLLKEGLRGLISLLQWRVPVENLRSCG